MQRPGLEPRGGRVRWTADLVTGGLDATRPAAEKLLRVTLDLGVVRREVEVTARTPARCCGAPSRLTRMHGKA